MFAVSFRGCGFGVLCKTGLLEFGLVSWAAEFNLSEVRVFTWHFHMHTCFFLLYLLTGGGGLDELKWLIVHNKSRVALL